MESNREWIYWGEKDPLWAVSSVQGKRRGEARAWTEAEFASFGVADWGTIRAQWEHYGLGSKRGRRRAIEIGCGAGRMTRPLLGTFESVLAIDVSAGMIERAKALLGAHAARVQFAVVDDPAIPAGDGSCDAVFSTHVFQHFSDLKGVREYLSLALNALAPGSSICVHFPVRGAHRGANLNRLRLRPHFVWNKVFHLTQSVLRRAGNLSHWDYTVFDPVKVFALLQDVGYGDLQMRIFDLASTNESHSFFFARRP